MNRVIREQHLASSSRSMTCNIVNIPVWLVICIVQQFASYTRTSDASASIRAKRTTYGFNNTSKPALKCQLSP